MAAAHDFAASVAEAVFTFVNAAGHSAAAFDAASVGRHSDYFGSVRWKHRAWDLSRGELRLGRSHLDQESGWFFNGLGSLIARLQTMPHLFAGLISALCNLCASAGWARLCVFAIFAPLREF